jgi:hypothetical protein
MELNGNNLKHKALTAVSKLKANIKGTYFNIAEIPSASVQQLAEFIQKHPDTQVSTKNLLGNTYNFFRLKINDDYFYLETSNDRILQLDGSSNEKELVAYRSYRDSYDLNTPIKLT